jgi:HNH endonuclease
LNKGHKGRPTVPIEKRFWMKVAGRELLDTETCWLWIGAQNGYGYGVISYGRRQVLAHRISWELHKGPIPEDSCILHKCDTPLCVNPDHLELGTQADNMRDKRIKNRVPKGEEHWNWKGITDDILLMIFLILKIKSEE